MAMENGKWRVVKGDCLWNIAKSVYNNPYRWHDIANANGIPQSRPIIYPGQLLILPGKSSNTSPVPNPVVSTKVRIDWFALDSGTTRSMFVAWSFDRADTKEYEVIWEYNTGQGGWRTTGPSTTTLKQSDFTADDNAKQVRVKITPKSDKWSNGQQVVREYDFSNNPPEMLSEPTFEIVSQINQSTKKLENIANISLENISQTVNADKVEFAIYQDDNYKYKTGLATINKETNFVKFVTTVDPGHFYRVRCRAVRNGNMYGGWSEYTANEVSSPIAPDRIIELRSQVISEQMSKKYAVFIEWTPVKSAKTYVIEWTTNKDLFDVGEVSHTETEEGKGPRLLINDLEVGHKYYFRVASKNDKGLSLTYTPIESVTLGIKPSAPTTYSNVSSCVVGEDLNLYWVHNALDGSIETYARLHIEVKDSAKPELAPTIIEKIIENKKPEADKNKTSVYTINTNDPEWATLGEGYIIKWKVQTAGVTSEYSDWSVEREVNVYAKPELAVNIQNGESVNIDEVNIFPFYILINSGPSTQIPLSYYIEIVANGDYETIGKDGKKVQVYKGQVVYQKYYDPQQNPWKFALEMTPGEIDLESGISYTINATVSMNSGLSASNKLTFNVLLNDLYYDVYGDVVINKNTLEASIKPYCYEYKTVNGETVPSLVTNCLLSVYRKNYDGTYILIKDNIPNNGETFVTDPHPSLDYARYRIVSRTNDTGAISFGDVTPIKVGETSIVIQWAEQWEPFKLSENDDGYVEPEWSGSMLKLPYNVSISENNKVDITMVNYAGRKRPVSYYGTHLGETASLSTDIPEYDKETLYMLRKLARWTNNVYIRESTGAGYWAYVEISFSRKYKDTIIPVTMNVTRVEGGI